RLAAGVERTDDLALTVADHDDVRGRRVRDPADVDHQTSDRGEREAAHRRGPAGEVTLRERHHRRVGERLLRADPHEGHESGPVTEALGPRAAEEEGGEGGLRAQGSREDARLHRAVDPTRRDERIVARVPDDADPEAPETDR